MFRRACLRAIRPAFRTISTSYTRPATSAIRPNGPVQRHRKNFRSACAEHHLHGEHAESEYTGARLVCGEHSRRRQNAVQRKTGLREAIQRGLAFNLGETGATQALRQSQGQSKVARSSLLPNLNGTVNENVQTTDLKTFGFRFSFPGFAIPDVIGPFNYIDFRAHLSQSVLDLTAINNYRAASNVARANRYSAQDARELIVLAVGGTYLQVTAAKAKVASEESQLQSANAAFDQSKQQLAQGLVAKVDADRNEVQSLTHQQRLLSLKNDLAKQKINLARMIGLPPNDQYDLTDEVPFSPATQVTIEDALAQAFRQRADLKAAEAQMHAAERAHPRRVPSATHLSE